MQDPDTHDERDWPLLDRVRAWSVPCLMETTFTAPHPLGALAACLQHLTAIFPTATWGVAPDAGVYPLVGALQKYGLFRAHVPAPPEMVTNQPMEVEIAGRITHLNGATIRSAAGQRLWAQLYAAPWEYQDATVHAHWLDSMEIQVFQATYANLWATGIHIPFSL